MSELKLRLQEPGKAPRDLVVKHGDTIGRDPSNSVVVSDPNVSGFHARIICSDDVFSIEDVGSSNKTRIVGGPALSKGERHVLDRETRMLLGKTILDAWPDTDAVEATQLARNIDKTELKVMPKEEAPKSPKAPKTEPKPIQAVDEPEAPPAEKPEVAPLDDEKTAAKPITPVAEEPEPTPEPKPEPKPEPTPEPTPEPKPEPAPEPKAEEPAAPPAEDAPAEPVEKKAAPAEVEDPTPAAEPAKAEKPAEKKPKAKKEVTVPKPPPGDREPRDFWLDRFVVDLSTYSVVHERVQCEDYEDVLGGAARGFKLLEKYGVDDPYSLDAPLVMNLGILSGSQFMTGLRTYFHGYSPLKVSNGGKPSAMWTAGSGKFGTKLRYLRVNEVVFTGRAVVPVYLEITPGEGDDAPANFRFHPAANLSGLHANQKIQKLHADYPEAHFAVIGPAGENWKDVRYASIALSTINQLRSGDMKSRFCGRGGFGGVMGSKNLLGIVANTPDADRGDKVEGLKEMNMVVARGEGSRRFRDKKKADGGGGTWANMTSLNPLHAMPEYNFAPTGTDVSVPLYRDSVEEKGDFLVKDEACFACGIACHKNLYEKNEEGKRGKFRAKFDYEPLNLLSANIGIFDIGQAAELVELVDDLCMDSISIGVTLAYAMEYNKRKQDADEPSILPDYIRYGDFEGAKRTITEIGTGKLPLLGQGSKRLSEALGEPEYAMHSKGIEFPAYLPQFNPGYPWALAGGHMSMRTYLLYVFEKEKGLDYWVEAITERGWMIMRDDVIGICKFAGMSNEHMADAITAMTRLAIDEPELERLVLRTFLRGYRLEKKQGFELDDYVMPAEIHEGSEKIDLEHFNTPEFFAQVRERVAARFDEMLAREGI